MQFTLLKSTRINEQMENKREIDDKPKTTILIELHCTLNTYIMKNPDDLMNEIEKMNGWCDKQANVNKQNERNNKHISCVRARINIIAP